MSRFTFYYGLGGGYTTSFRSPSASRVPEVGLAEVLLLRQATELAARVSALYPPGVRFSLVIDNLSAYLVEDVPVAQTLVYCRKLRSLVDALGLSARTDLIVTSEHFTVSDFAEAWPSGGDVPDVGALTNKPHRIARHDAVGVDEAADVELVRRAHAARQAAEQLAGADDPWRVSDGPDEGGGAGLPSIPGWGSGRRAGRGRAARARAARRSARWC